MVEKNVDAEKNILSSLKDLDLYLSQLPDKMDVIRPLAEPGITRAKMAKALGCSESTVKRIIQTLKELFFEEK